MGKGKNGNLAQLNIAKMMYGADDPEMQEFNAALDSVNAYAFGFANYSYSGGRSLAGKNWPLDSMNMKSCLLS